MLDNEFEEITNVPEKSEKKPYQKIRIRPVDFMRVEGQHYGSRDLSPFELKVLEKLAGVPSASDLLVQEEDRVRRLIGVRMRMSNLIRRSRLTPRQKTCYRLLYVEGLRAEKTAQKMGVDVDRIYEFKEIIFKELQKTVQRYEIGMRIRKFLTKFVSERHRLVSDLYYLRGFSAKEIAKRLQISRIAVHLILNSLEGKLLARTQRT